MVTSLSRLVGVAAAHAPGSISSNSSDFKNDEMEGVDFRNGCPSPAISRSAACDDYVEMAGPLRWRLIGMENGKISTVLP